MPRLASDIDDMSDVGEIPSNGVPAHRESAIEAEVEAKDQLQDELADDIGKISGSDAKEEELNRVTDDEDAEDNGEDEFEVEAIRSHEWRRAKGKKTGPKSLLYVVKWKGWPDSDNTLEPEENLSAARDILAAYHHKIGGAPQPEPETELKKKRSTKSLQDTSNVDSTAEESPAPSAKRQKRMTSNHDDSLIKEDDAEAEWGAWTPKSKTWEDDIKEIQTVERDPKTQDLYIFIVFKNGKKSKVKREAVHKKCPLRMLEFYENHLSV